MTTMELSDLNVLVVDDDEFMLDLVSATLNGIGVAKVSTALEGVQALQTLAASASPYHVVMCDLNMPTMDGVEFLRHLADRNYAGGIVLFSGEDQRILKTATDLAAAHHLNVLGALEKPVTPAGVEELLCRYEYGNEKKQQFHPAEISAAELRSAITNDQLVVFYQPKINVKTHEIVGVESLVRWIHPERGIIPPIAFISVAEEHGLIDVLTETVYRQAMQQGGRWSAQGLDLKVAVNLSMDNLDRINLPDLLVDIAKAHGMNVANVMLEITESRLIQNLTMALEIMTRMRLKGLGLSIDDFGTGYSSMEQLKKIPFTELKIDRAFVHGAVTDSAARAILESSVVLAKKLGMTIVAEGVEDQADWDLVAELGCDLVQGYFIAKPMPGDEFTAWLLNWNARQEQAI